MIQCGWGANVGFLRSGGRGVGIAVWVGTNGGIETRGERLGLSGLGWGSGRHSDMEGEVWAVRSKLGLTEAQRYGGRGLGCPVRVGAHGGTVTRRERLGMSGRLCCVGRHSVIVGGHCAVRSS